MTLSAGNTKLIAYGLAAAIGVYVIHEVTKTINGLSNTLKKSIPWIAGGAAVVGLAYMVMKSKKEEKSKPV